ncbi:MAG: zinc finger domain-containing protein [Nanoarchaeota archaeon]
MPTKKLLCSSCKNNVASSRGTTVFNCPACGKTEIVRCMHCRKTAAKYVCFSCNFEGPN